MEGDGTCFAKQWPSLPSLHPASASEGSWPVALALCTFRSARSSSCRLRRGKGQVPGVEVSQAFSRGCFCACPQETKGVDDTACPKFGLEFGHRHNVGPASTMTLRLMCCMHACSAMHCAAVMSVCLSVWLPAFLPACESRVSVYLLVFLTLSLTLSLPLSASVGMYVSRTYVCTKVSIHPSVGRSVSLTSIASSGVFCLHI